jgi:hypothetical protein
MKNLTYFVLSLLVFSFVNQNLLYSRSPYPCGIIDGILGLTEWIGPLDLNSGIKYEKLSEHEKDCATEGRSGVCNCHVTLGVISKYQFEGEVKADWFGLTGSWAEETTVSAEDTKNLSTTAPGDCVGPMWGYKKRNYEQKCKIRVPTGSTALYCQPCSSNSVLSTLFKSPYVTCSSSEHEEYEPALKTGNAVCE